MKRCLGGIQEHVNMVLYNFRSMDFVAFLRANIVEDRLAILFNLIIVEYLVLILRHQHDVAGNLTRARVFATLCFSRVIKNHGKIRGLTAIIPRMITQGTLKKDV